MLEILAGGFGFRQSRGRLQHVIAGGTPALNPQQRQTGQAGAGHLLGPCLVKLGQRGGLRGGAGFQAGQLLPQPLQAVDVSLQFRRLPSLVMALVRQQVSMGNLLLVIVGGRFQCQPSGPYRHPGIIAFGPLALNLGLGDRLMGGAILADFQFQQAALGAGFLDPLGQSGDLQLDPGALLQESADLRRGRNHQAAQGLGVKLPFAQGQGGLTQFAPQPIRLPAQTLVLGLDIAKRTSPGCGVGQIRRHHDRG